MKAFIRKWAAPVLAPSGVATFIAFVVVWIYLNRLGRLDVFYSTLTVKSMVGVIIASAVVAIVSIMLMFFMTSFLMALTIPADNENMYDYERVREWAVKAILVSGLFPLLFIISFTILGGENFGVSTFWVCVSLIALAIMIMLATKLFLGKSIASQLKPKTQVVRRKYFRKIYLWNPLVISLIAHTQVLPVNLISLHIKFPEDFDDRAQLISLYFLSFSLYMLTLLPGVIFLRANQKDTLLKRALFPSVTALSLLLLISAYLTIIPVIFVHAVMKTAGVSDFSSHHFLIEKEKYPENLFNKELWETYVVGDTRYVRIKAVLFFSFGDTRLLCPEGIIDAYKKSWDFMPFSSSFDNEAREALRALGAYCFSPETKDYMQWDSPLSTDKVK
ncbi:hypothetical protein [Cronobacter universalis]|uniref:hypothetical protein n=1 Tax=Cronobacter universalis TaxID=535744 RepID=UPI003CF60723